MIVNALQQMVGGAYLRSCQRCNDWSGQRVARLRPQSLLDVGCADGAFLFKYLDYKPQLFCGIEAAPELKKKRKDWLKSFAFVRKQNRCGGQKLKPG